MMTDVTELLTRARRLGFEVRAEGGKLKVRCPRQYEALARALLARKVEVLAVLAAESQGSARASREGLQPSPAAPRAPARSRRRDLESCPYCGAKLAWADVWKYMDCPRCRRILPVWEDVPTPAGPTTQKGDSRDSVSS